MFQVQVVWNREHHFSRYGEPVEKFQDAVKLAESAKDTGDKKRVKSVKVTNDMKCVWIDGRLTNLDN